MWVLNKQRVTEDGNTIVEVLIALAIIGMVIAGAYATADRSVRITQQSQERTRATKIAEQQLELLRSIVVADGTDKDAIFTTTSVFCINDDATGSRVSLITGAIPDNEQDADLTSGSGGVYPVECVYDELYHASIDRDDSADNPRFTVQVRWARLGGGIDQVKFTYGISEGS